MKTSIGGAAWLCVFVCSSAANAQATGQIWGNAFVDWLATSRLTCEVDVEPKAQVVVHDDQPTWGDLDTTPRVLYAVTPWMDVLGETDIGIKNQSNETNTVTVSPRAGVELHILSRILQEDAARGGAGREPLPRQRFNIHTLLRLEDEITTSNAAATKTSWRFRDRFAVAYPLNRPKTTSDGAVYLTTDTEIFVPLGAPADGFTISELRNRTGVGYRRSFSWQFEALYIWDGERKGTGPLAVDAHALDLRVRYQF